MRWVWAAPITLVLVTLLLVVVWAQAPPETPAVPPPLENTGKPMRPPFQCIDDDIHFGGLSCTEEQPCPIYLELFSLAPTTGKPGASRSSEFAGPLSIGYASSTFSTDG